VRVAVLADVHGNLPALTAALQRVARLDVDATVHLGDAIGIGPYPAECLDLLLNVPRMRLVMGNHDAWFAFGLPAPRPPWMSEGEVAHQQWTHDQIDPSLRPVVAAWPPAIEARFGDTGVAFVHYGLAGAAGHLVPNKPDPNPAELDAMFAAHRGEIVFFGHDHTPLQRRGCRLYVNPGSLGCCDRPEARFALLDVEDADYRIETHAVPYDDADLFRAFERRRVPERDFIRRGFFGRP